MGKGGLKSEAAGGAGRARVEPGLAVEASARPEVDEVDDPSGRSRPAPRRRDSNGSKRPEPEARTDSQVTESG